MTAAGTIGFGSSEVAFGPSAYSLSGVKSVDGSKDIFASVGGWNLGVNTASRLTENIHLSLNYEFQNMRFQQPTSSTLQGGNVITNTAALGLIFKIGSDWELKTSYGLVQVPLYTYSSLTNNFDIYVKTVGAGTLELANTLLQGKQFSLSGRLWGKMLAEDTQGSHPNKSGSAYGEELQIIYASDKKSHWNLGVKNERSNLKTDDASYQFDSLHMIMGFTQLF